MSVVAHTGVDHALIGVAAALAIGVYGVAWLRHPVAVRLWCWVAGVGLVVLASTPWMERLADESFAGHMVQHLVVIIGAAPLLVLARPVHTMVRAGWIPTTRTGRVGRRGLAPLRRRRRAGAVRGRAVRDAPDVGLRPRPR